MSNYLCTQETANKINAEISRMQKKLNEADVRIAEIAQLKEALRAVGDEIERQNMCIEKLSHTYKTGAVYWSDGNVKPHVPEVK